MDHKLIGLLPFTLLIAISTFLLWKLLPGTKPFDYGLTIDAGSSHSEIILYKWSEKVNGTGHAEQISNIEVIAGIDDYREDIVSAVTGLYSAVNAIVGQIPEEAIPPFPLFMGATGGVRILNLSNPGLVERMMDSIRHNLSESHFADGRSINVKQARILTGMEEGLYAWVTVNYLLNFKSDDEDQGLFDKLIQSRKGRSQTNTSLPTIGILDMGGASTQVAYQVPRGPRDAAVTLFGEIYKIRSRSDLCFGSDQAYLRYLFELFRLHSIKDGVIIEDIVKNGSVSVPDPCNYDSPVNMVIVSEFLSNPCLKTFKPISTGDLSNITVLYEPSMNHSKCAEIIIELLDESHCALTYDRCFESLPDDLPNDNHFIATSSYYFSARVLPSFRNGSDTFIDENHYASQVVQWCTTPWSEKIKLTEVKYARFLCFKQLYVFYTLKMVYHVENRLWPYIHFRNKIGQSSLSWSLGYMLAETNLIPAKPSRPQAWTTYTFYLSIAAVIGVSLFLIVYWIRKRSKEAVINGKG